MDKKRYEKEIEEILAKYDQEFGRKDKPKPEVPTSLRGKVVSGQVCRPLEATPLAVAISNRRSPLP